MANPYCSTKPVATCIVQYRSPLAFWSQWGRAYMLTCLHVYMLTCLHAYMLTCLHAYMFTSLHAYMFTCLHVYMLTCLHVYMLTCAHGLAHMQVYAAHLHTCAQAQLHAHIKVNRQTQRHGRGRVIGRALVCTDMCTYM